MIVNNEEEMIELGYNFSKKLKVSDVIVFTGNLGSGKTTFIKGIAKGLEINKNITSPTFNIIKEYDEKLCHVDAYRVSDEDIGLDNYLDDYIICIEWYENIQNYLPKIDYHITINYLEEKRELTIKE